MLRKLAEHALGMRRAPTRELDTTLGYHTRYLFKFSELLFGGLFVFVFREEESMV